MDEHDRDGISAVMRTIVKFSVAQMDWCAKEHDCVVDGKTYKHTMCKDSSNDREFVNITDVATDESRKNILRLHNAFRNNTAGGQAKWPKGGNIRQMTWDYTLESLATNWAMACKAEHDVCRKTPNYPVVGQNFGVVSFRPGDSNPSEEIVSDWIKTQNDVDSGSITGTINSFASGTWEDASLIIWAETIKIGCGEVRCINDNVGTPQKNFRVLVCNYAPGGNIPSSPIYKTGDPCTTGCPAGTACKKESLYTQLCAAPGDPTDDSLGAGPRPTPAPGPGPNPSTRPAPGPGPNPSTRPAPGPGPNPSTRPAPGPGPNPSTRPAPGPSTLPDPTTSTGSDLTIPTIPTIPTLPTLPTSPSIPTAPYINFSPAKMSWRLVLLLCFSFLSKLA